MGKAKRRINPKVKTKVDRRIKELAIAQIWEVVLALSEPWIRAGKGRKGYPAKQMAAINIYKEQFGLTYDGMEAELRVNTAIAQTLQLKTLPSSSSIHRSAKKLRERYIRTVNKQLIKGYKCKTVAVDSTGFSLRNSSAYYDIRIGRSKKREWMKLHALEDCNTGLIVSYRVTKGKAHDSPQFKSLIRNLKEIDVVGDSSYLSMKNCCLVEEKGGKPFFLPKKNTRTEARHRKPWKRMMRAFIADTKGWLSIYHIRSVIEGMFSSVKRKFRSYLRAVKKRMQRKELALKVICYNIRQVLLVKAAEYLGLPLWVETHR